jgi:RNA polymerase sigma factor (sigma-70 family)
LTRGPRNDPDGKQDDGMDATLTVTAGVPDRAHGKAFADLVAGQLDGAYRLATIILGDAIEAEDAVSDAAIAAWAGFASLRDATRFEAWFGRILVNGCRDRLRRRKRVRLVDLGPMLEILQEHPRHADPSADAVDRDTVARAMTRLDPDHQVALVLRYWLDLPVDAIAERLAIPEGTAKSRIHHAKRRLRQILDDEARR